MKIFALIVLMIFSLAIGPTPVWAQTMERVVEMHFDGDIDYTSESGGPAGRTILHMEGTGKASVEVSTDVNGASIKHSASGQSEGITVTSGVQFYTGDLYVTRSEGNAKWSHEYSGEINTFPTIFVATEDTTYGSFKRVIDMENRGMWIDERFSVKGFSWVTDMLQFTPASE